MWYIINQSTNTCISTCTVEPEHDDVAQQGCIAIHSTIQAQVKDIIYDGTTIAVNTQVPDKEQLTRKIRKTRNKLLLATDWVELPSNQARFTESEKVELALYRQALRDFPSSCDPVNPVWPTPPTIL